MKKIIFSLSLCIGFGTAHADLDSLVNAAKKFAISQVAVTKGQVPAGKVARFVGPDGKWQSVGPTDWTGGFYPGYLWLAYELSNDSTLKTAAEQATSLLAVMQRDKSTHDIGFAINTSYGNGYRLTKNDAYRVVGDTAAGSFATRYNANVRATRSWSWGEWATTFCVITDNMVNLELLYFGAKNGGDPKWGTYATNHAIRTATDHIRPDGSTFHMVTYNEKTGDVIRKRSFYTGLADSTTWACGQAWALYGMTMAYRESKNDTLLKAAQKMADWYLKNLPSDGVPYWNFSAPKTDFRDVAAGVIALSAILELSTLVATDTARVRYFNQASAILASLCGPGYLAKGKNTAGILIHGHGDADNETDCSLIYADYYFMQSILRYEAYKKRYPTGILPKTDKPSKAKALPLHSEVLHNIKGQALASDTRSASLGSAGVVFDQDGQSVRARVLKP